MFQTAEIRAERKLKKKECAGVFGESTATLVGKLQSASWSGRVSYDPSGKKVFWRGKVDDTIGAWIGCEIYFHGITGQRLARYQCNDDWGTENQGAFGLSLTDGRSTSGGS